MHYDVYGEPDVDHGPRLRDTFGFVLSVPLERAYDLLTGHTVKPVSSEPVSQGRIRDIPKSLAVRADMVYTRRFLHF